MNRPACVLLGAVFVLAIMLVPAAYAQQQFATPAITSPAPNDVIDSNTFTVTGTAEPDNLVVLTDLNNEFLGRAQSSPDGGWSLDVTLPDGMHGMVAVTRPDPGMFLRSDPVMITVSGGDSGSGGAPELEIQFPPSGAILREGTAVVSGMAPPNYAVQLFDDSRILLSGTVADGDGRWSSEIHLPNGMHFIVVVAASSAEDISHVINVVCAGGSTQCAVGLQGSDVISERIFLHAFGEDHSGVIWPELTSPISGSTISGTTFVMAGVSEPNAQIVIRDMFLSTIGVTAADEAGDWSVEVSDHPGLHVYSIVAATEARPDLHTMVFLNLEGEGSSTPTPEITSPASGTSLTSGNNVLVTGTATPDSLVVLIDLRFLPLATAIADSAGDWSMTINLEAGTTILMAAQVTSDVIPAHSEFAIIHVDPDAPALDRPVIASPNDLSLHRDSAVVVSGTAPPNSMVRIFNNEAEIAATASDGAGAWSATIEVPDGMYILYAIASSGDGEGSAPSELVRMFVNAHYDLPPKACR